MEIQRSYKFLRSLETTSGSLASPSSTFTSRKNIIKKTHTCRKYKQGLNSPTNIIYMKAKKKLIEEI